MKKTQFLDNFLNLAQYKSSLKHQVFLILCLSDNTMCVDYFTRKLKISSFHFWRYRHSKQLNKLLLPWLPIGTVYHLSCRDPNDFFADSCNTIYAASLMWKPKKSEVMFLRNVGWKKAKNAFFDIFSNFSLIYTWFETWDFFYI